MKIETVDSPPPLVNKTLIVAQMHFRLALQKSLNTSQSPNIKLLFLSA